MVDRLDTPAERVILTLLEGVKKTKKSCGAFGAVCYIHAPLNGGNAGFLALLFEVKRTFGELH